MHLFNACSFSLPHSDFSRSNNGFHSAQNIFYPHFVLLNNSLAKKKEHICRRMRLQGRLTGKGREVRKGGRLSTGVSLYWYLHAAVIFSGFILCFSAQPRPYHDSFEGKIELKMEKKQICESDSWFWLPPTERVKKFIVSVDTWFLVIYCLLLLFLKLFSYFILQDGCGKSFLVIWN